MRCGVLPTLINCTGEKLIALLPFLADLKDTSDNCGVCENWTIGVIVYFLSDGANAAYEAYSNYAMSTDAQS